MKIAIIIVCVIVVLIILFMIFSPKGPDPKAFEHLVNPSISQKEDQNMIVVETSGDPSKTAGAALGLLIKTYYNQSQVEKSMRMPAPRARWESDVSADRKEWYAYYAMPVPDQVQALEDVKNPKNLKIYVQKWEYGTVAEILHKGPYETEKGTVDRLHEYIKSQGYRIIGFHEEEYVKGPGMFGKGNPEKYLTIIRYRVVKSDSL